MNKFEAEKIVNDYGKAIASETTSARSLSLLNCDKSVIKYAFFTYIEAMISGKIFTDEILDKLIVVYSYIDCFIEDDRASLINEIIKRVKNKQIDLYSEESKDLKTLFDQFMSIFTSNMAQYEITNFILSMKDKYQ